jgi:hypothetical protein
MRRRLILFALFIIFFTTTHAQYAGWMLGTWKSTGVAGSVTQTIQITDVTREKFYLVPRQVKGMMARMVKSPFQYLVLSEE